jgi:chromatin segregation and condensation protein Rec8/ScpA/Scc1 (kleisin family)
VLFELHKLRKIKPWDVNISFLLTSLLKEMDKRGEVDFRASGMALDSSSTIYLMKSKLLLKLEEPPAPSKPPPGFIPPPLFLPLRYELTSTTIQHLLKALDEVLTGERILALRPRVEPVLPPPPEFIPQVDLYLMEIEKMMDELYSSILRFAGEGRLITFSRFTAGMKKLEAIKTFITLLFLAQTGKASLWQEEDFSDIYITLREGPPIDG